MADASHGSDGDSDDTGRRAARAGSGQVLAEVMVRPGSEMAGRTPEEVAFRHKHQCIVLGIERPSRMLRERITRMLLMDGDVMTIQRQAEAVYALPCVTAAGLWGWEEATGRG